MVPLFLHYTRRSPLDAAAITVLRHATGAVDLFWRRTAHPHELATAEGPGIVSADSLHFAPKWRKIPGGRQEIKMYLIIEHLKGIPLCSVRV